MSDRSRPPTDGEPTAVHGDPDRPPGAQARAAQPRPRTPTKKGAGVELATPTAVSPPRPEPAAPVPAAVPEQTRSEPIRVISMKAPGEARGDASEPSQPVKQHQPRLRPLSEVSQQRRAALTPPAGLGYLAPPRDPKEARTRRQREYVIWGSVVVMLAGVVMLAVWFLAGM